MKKPATIQSVESETRFPNELVESFPNYTRSHRRAFTQANARGSQFSEKYAELDWQSACVYADATVQISLAPGFFGKQKKISFPLVTVFLLTCTRDEKTGYKLSWVSSLS